MTEPRLTAFDAFAIQGANLLSDDDLAGQLAELIDRVATGLDELELIQDLRELAAVCLVTARRLEASR